eukprot:CAMPEP_0117613684 /NCGR_PEP_ID=MMETSP0784-20121206/83604_1 /TAXON_ID=39447 /ORGANISM="" /LENGTH=88 /DNA_ID=CAMNT_0005417303 /DNA_START=88 /DNA_END=351 /DNA_ORIENTATION=+
MEFEQQLTSKQATIHKLQSIIKKGMEGFDAHNSVEFQELEEQFIAVSQEKAQVREELESTQKDMNKKDARISALEEELGNAQATFNKK